MDTGDNENINHSHYLGRCEQDSACNETDDDMHNNESEMEMDDCIKTHPDVEGDVEEGGESDHMPNNVKNEEVETDSRQDDNGV